MPSSILLDGGDTLAADSTEQTNTLGETQQADLIPGAREMVLELKRRVHPLPLCADGPVAMFAISRRLRMSTHLCSKRCSTALVW